MKSRCLQADRLRHDAVTALDSVHCANRELIKANSGTEPYDTDDYHDDLSKRLKDWLEHLHPTMKAIVDHLPHAASFSFTFGTTISMTMNYQKLPEDNGPPASP